MSRFTKTLIKASSFKTASRRSVASDLKQTLIRASHECSQGFGADEFKAICEEFLAQYGTEDEQVVQEAKTTPLTPAQKAQATKKANAEKKAEDKADSLDSLLD